MRKTADVFPAIVKLAPPNSLEDFSTLQPVGDSPKGTRRLDRCRVVVLSDVLMIAVDSPQGPELVFREKVTNFSVEKEIYHALSESGKILSFKKDNNCGCGSRLRSWNPTKGILFSD